jgi:hypothetical protein
MAHHTTEPRADTMPPDIELMRGTVHRALAEHPQPDELDTLGATLRGHIALLIPEVEQLAGKQSRDSALRFCALACLGEARAKLRMGDGAPHLDVRVTVVQKLARVAKALCEHYENLGGRT